MHSHSTSPLQALASQPPKGRKYASERPWGKLSNLLDGLVTSSMARSPSPERIGEMSNVGGDCFHHAFFEQRPDDIFIQEAVVGKMPARFHPMAPDELLNQYNPLWLGRAIPFSQERPLCSSNGPKQLSQEREPRPDEDFRWGTHIPRQRFEENMKEHEIWDPTRGTYRWPMSYTGRQTNYNRGECQQKDDLPLPGYDLILPEILNKVMEATSDQLMGLLEQEMARRTLEKRIKLRRKQECDLDAHTNGVCDRSHMIHSQVLEVDRNVDEGAGDLDTGTRKTGCHL